MRTTTTTAAEPTIVKLHALADQLHEFTIHFTDEDRRLVAYQTILARVKVIPESPAVWLGNLCFSGLNTNAELQSNQTYVIEIGATS